MARYAWIAYAAPMALFALLTAAESTAPISWYAAVYTAKAAIVTAALIAGLRVWRPDVRMDTRALPMAVIVGLAVFAEWVLVERWLPYPHLGHRSAYNPFLAIQDPAMRGAFIAVRFYGLALMVPVMEELFWRDLAIRWLTRPDFRSVPIGVFSAAAFWLVAAGFGLEHPEWVAAVICAAAYAALLWRTRSLGACMVAHATTNLALGVYVIMTGEWKYW